MHSQFADIITKFDYLMITTRMNDEGVEGKFSDIIKLSIVHLLSKFYQNWNFFPLSWEVKIYIGIKTNDL